MFLLIAASHAIAKIWKQPRFPATVNKEGVCTQTEWNVIHQLK